MDTLLIFRNNTNWYNPQWIMAQIDIATIGDNFTLTEEFVLANTGKQRNRALLELGNYEVVGIGDYSSPFLQRLPYSYSVYLVKR